MRKFGNLSGCVDRGGGHWRRQKGTAAPRDSERKQTHPESNGTQKMFIDDKTVRCRSCPIPSAFIPFVQPASRPISGTDGTLEHARQIAAHELSRTTKLYDGTQNDISLDEVGRI
jgi:hypothetical protein